MWDEDIFNKIAGILSISALGIICAIIDALIKEDD